LALWILQERKQNAKNKNEEQNFSTINRGAGLSLVLGLISQVKNGKPHMETTSVSLCSVTSDYCQFSNFHETMNGGAFKKGPSRSARLVKIRSVKIKIFLAN